ncbi:MAG: hypothetical protein AUJ74_02350 [Candidatus Omnitrophica bacterium CG1_02_44_16]|nr:MAG: hypothetical protein AUJ74_02350 [Candidatus Omnitrophica bacterium CG1_02_44_16]PIY82543.1 MAG: hypothetical protein COY78_06845 [Candidatus Omnitrophica bacterium CG_4_10_14_0_8_um_filter_44_12]
MRHLRPRHGFDGIGHNLGYCLLHLSAIDLELLRSITIHEGNYTVEAPEKKEKSTEELTPGANRNCAGVLPSAKGKG